jgi:antitoxin (DNA-binding transcriptional repressor) of toxin-antitoxin stability system
MSGDGISSCLGYTNSVTVQESVDSGCARFVRFVLLTYWVYALEAKTYLSHLLKRVSKGERITITKHGVSVATLQAPDAKNKYPVNEVIEELRKFRKRHQLGTLSIGTDWLKLKSSLLLDIPSAVLAQEVNILINPT